MDAESHSRSPKAAAENKKDTKPSGKVGRKRSNAAEEWAAKWEKHADNVNGHFILKGKTVLDKAVLALWAIHKAGGGSASSLYIQRFIAVAFSFNEKERSLDTTLQRKGAQEFVIKTEGGFKLTPSGTKRAVEMAKATK
jgi:cell division GTPase FtsZ